MRKKKKKERTEGTLIRGADGGLYFVPDGEKWAFLLPDQYTADARALLDELNFVPKREELPAIHAAGLVRRIDPHEVQINLDRLVTLVKGTKHKR